MDITSSMVADLDEIRSRKPLIHHITNFVVMNETANLTLSLGALPVMAHAREEVEEMASMAGALVLNIGTLWPELIESMIVAGKAANRAGVPVVLDPVGAGATKLRSDAALRILGDVDVAVVRANLAEAATIAGLKAEISGVESVSAADDPAEVALEFVRRHGCCVAVTGKEDIVTDGTRTAVVANGDAMLTTVTGTGCMSTTVVGGFLAVQPDPVVAAAEGLATFGVAAEAAAQTTQGLPGRFHAALYDAMALIGGLDLKASARVRMETSAKVRMH